MSYHIKFCGFAFNIFFLKIWVSGLDLLGRGVDRWPRYTISIS